jgi:hypothetical protein
LQKGQILGIGQKTQFPRPGSLQRIDSSDFNRWNLARQSKPQPVGQIFKSIFRHGKIQLFLKNLLLQAIIGMSKLF